jgi:excisionase family DNA binding protein
MVRSSDFVGYPDRPHFPDRPIAPTEIPGLMADLVRRMAELWLEAFTSARSAAPASTIADRDSDYTVTELGKRLQMSKSTIYKHWRAGAWPNAYMIGKRKGLRIPKRDVDTWKASSAHGTPTWGIRPAAKVRSIKATSL